MFGSITVVGHTVHGPECGFSVGGRQGTVRDTTVAQLSRPAATNTATTSTATTSTNSTATTTATGNSHSLRDERLLPQ